MSRIDRIKNALCLLAVSAFLGVAVAQVSTDQNVSGVGLANGATSPKVFPPLPAATLWGNPGSSAANVQPITLGTGLSFTGTTINASSGGGSSSSGGGNVSTTGTPASGNLSCFTGSATISNCNLSGDAATSNTAAVSVNLLHPTTNAYTSSHTITSTEEVIECNATSALTMTLPAATGTHKHYWLKNNNTGVCTIAAAGSDTIDSLSTAPLSTIFSSMELIDAAAGSWARLAQSQLGGDLSGTPSAATVSKVNGGTPGGSCANQVVTSVNASAQPTCNTITSAYTNSSIAITGTDINTSGQVVSLHLTTPLPAAQIANPLTQNTTGTAAGISGSITPNYGYFGPASGSAG